VSYEFDWIRAVVCQESVNPPSYFSCGETETLPPIPSLVEPTVLNPIDFVFAFTADSNPGDNGESM
jgi:hypothetical protein